MQKVKNLAPIVASLFLFAAIATLSASATSIPTFTLSAQSSQLNFALPAGTTFNGSISTTGTIRFWVSDPQGFQIVNLGLIDQKATFGFVAQQIGNYTLNFENDLPAAVQVTFSYETSPEVPINNSKFIPLVYLSIPIAVAIIGSVLIFVLLRRKRKPDGTACT
jgi:hypothetical protein